MIDSKKFNLPFRNNSSSYYQCPTCKNGHLKIKNGTFSSHESRISLESHEHPNFNFDYVSYVYSCLFECTNDACKETVASSGYGYVDFDIEVSPDGIPEQVYIDCYKPLHFQPALKIINIPNSVPSDVKKIINKSFDVYFVSPSSCINYIRTSLEAILNNLKVQKFVINRKGKRQALTLHSRITKLPTKYNDLKEIFEALKWLGNSGSHIDASKVTLNDALASYEFLEYLLDEVYAKKSKLIKQRAKNINKTKGIK